jgi:hypothetical protein
MEGWSAGDAQEPAGDLPAGAAAFTPAELL